MHKEVFIKADKVVVDDWSQCNREKKTINQLVLEGKFSKEALHAELGQLVTGDIPGREDDDEIILLNPMECLLYLSTGTTTKYWDNIEPILRMRGV
nr:hypothetical protein PD502_01165 [Staphylococcus aureus]